LSDGDGIDQVQCTGLLRDLAGRRDIGQRAHLIGVTGLNLEELALQLVNLDLAIRDDHAAQHRTTQRERHDDRGPARPGRGTPT